MFFKKSASSANRRRENSKANSSGWAKLHSSTGSRRSSHNNRRKPRKPTKQELDDQTQTLHAQIGALEDFIAGSPFRDHRERFRRRDTVPPPERNATSSPAANRRRRGELTLREKAALRKERFNHLLTFVALFGSVCAMLYWLLQII